MFVKSRKKPAGGGVSWGCDPRSIENGSLLQDWLTGEGLAKQKLVLERVESGGRGLVATQSLRQGERHGQPGIAQRHSGLQFG